LLPEGGLAPDRNTGGTQRVDVSVEIQMLKHPDFQLSTETLAGPVNLDLINWVTGCCCRCKLYQIVLLWLAYGRRQQVASSSRRRLCSPLGARTGRCDGPAASAPGLCPAASRRHALRRRGFASMSSLFTSPNFLFARIPEVDLARSVLLSSDPALQKRASKSRRKKQ
jgi:hypothetical protein